MTGNNWDIVLNDVYHEPYFINIVKFVNQIYKEKIVFPPKTKILKALTTTDYNDVKVVILGQDPYHGVGEANGLAFSVSDGIKLPPSLRNIYKELHDDLGIPISNKGNLECWAKEGVLLLNAVLTVEAHTPTSHKDHGWEQFTDQVIEIINKKTTPVVFILWGSYARAKKKLITNPIHYVIESAHPSPFSAYNGFFGSKPFSKTNNFLISKGIKPIDWRVE